MNVSNFPARRIDRSSETPTKKYDQAVSEFGSTVFENNRKDSIRTVSLSRIKAKECPENVIIKNFNFRYELVRGWKSRRNMKSNRSIRRQLWSHPVEVKEGKMKK